MTPTTNAMLFNVHYIASLFEEHFEEIIFLMRYTAITSTLILVLFIAKWICDTRRRKKDK